MLAAGDAMTFPRVVSHEILDGLAADDPQALRARRDLLRVNRFMGGPGMLLRALRPIVGRHPVGEPVRVLELGAGDGRLMLRLAHRAPRAWPTIELTFLDRQPLIDAATCAQFGRLGWVARSLIRDVLDWMRAPAPGAAGHWDVIVTNLFLHHFDERELPALMSAIAGRCDAFLACEPRRALLPLAGSHLMGFIGASSITRHDAVLSVRAGFRGQELSSIWPGGQARWQLREQERGLFSHLFQAVRDTTALPTVA
jgi:hypothetical protein